MTPPHMNEMFTARELVSILHGVNLSFESENLRDWHRRELIPGEPVGRGRDRYYSIQELIYIAALAFVAPRVKHGDLFVARRPARLLADMILEVWNSEGKDNYVDQYPVFVLIYRFGKPVFEKVGESLLFRRVASGYGFHGAVVVAPAQMAMDLFGHIRETLRERAAKQDAQ